jgi:hypothetical protein
LGRGLEQVASEEAVQQTMAVINAIHPEKVQDVGVAVATALKTMEEARG